MFIEPVGLPEGELHLWCLSKDHEDNFCMEDLGYFDLPNGFTIDLGYYRDEYCTKVIVNQQYEENQHPCWLEIDLRHQLCEEDYTCEDPITAMKQFVEIANLFSKVKIKIG